MIVVQKKCLIAYAKLNESGSFMTNHEISCLKQGERNERFWTFGPSLVGDMLKRGDLQRQITPPPPPPHKSLGTQRELMTKISGKSQTIIKWCKNM